MFGKIYCASYFPLVISSFSRSWAVLITWMWDVPHVLHDRYYISVAHMNPNHFAKYLTHCLQTLAPLLCLPYPLFWPASQDETVGLQNPTSLMIL
jgi:hypothetical protein